MSTLILDACVAISMLIEENDTPAARALLADFRNQIHELIAPDSMRGTRGRAGVQGRVFGQEDENALPRSCNPPR